MRLPIFLYLDAAAAVDGIVVAVGGGGDVVAAAAAAAAVAVVAGSYGLSDLHLALFINIYGMEKHTQTHTQYQFDYTWNACTLTLHVFSGNNENTLTILRTRHTRHTATFSRGLCCFVVVVVVIVVFFFSSSISKKYSHQQFQSVIVFRAHSHLRSFHSDEIESKEFSMKRTQLLRFHYPNHNIT